MSADYPSVQDIQRLDHLPGFAGRHQTEAEPGALPRRGKSPQRTSLGR